MATATSLTDSLRMPEEPRQLALRRAGRCVACARPLAVGTRAWWDPQRRTVTCVSCWTAPAQTVESVPGGSAQREYEKRQAREREAAQRNMLTRLRYRFGGDRQSTRAWGVGAEGERILGARLEKISGDRLFVLHDRAVPNSHANIDHIVVAPSGVHLIDAKRYSGRIEIRDKGGWFSRDDRLYVAGRDRTPLITNLAKQIIALDAAVRDLTPTLPVTAALCFVNGDWQFFIDGTKIRGVAVVSSKRLERFLAREGPLSPNEIGSIGETLSTRLPPRLAT